jgi:hypothetical membrane protein
LVTAGSVILMGIITGEIFYPPGYSTALNDISDLGATRPPNSVIHQPSATIFNWAMRISGLLISLVAIFLLRAKRWLFNIPFLVFGISVLGVGLFPGDRAPWHGLFALTTFFFGAVSALTTFRITTSTYRLAGMVFGAVSLAFLFLSTSIAEWMGSGGTERWVAYPILLWLVGLGGEMSAGRENH